MADWGVFALDPVALNLDYREFYRAIIGDYGKREQRQRKPMRPRHTAEWRHIRERVFERDDYTCRYCGSRGGRLECDHVHPVSKGGRDDEANLATSCFTCNRSKRNKSLEEWMAG